jgi:cyclopropane fatty-acyl-phospholipid synthase-like methyltransferase
MRARDGTNAAARGADDDPTPAAAAQIDRVREYYDSNSDAFERLGQGKTAIHRAVWAQGVVSRVQAFAYVDALIAERAADLGDTPRLLDLGCGLGASLIQIARHLPQATLLGITISPKQALRAQAFLEHAGLPPRVRCVEGDFLDPAADVGRFDLAFAIESFVHAPDPASFFRAAAMRVRPGGKLIICDDFRGGPSSSPRDERLLRRFQEGWAAGTLTTVEAAAASAKAYGFQLSEDLDLTGYLELRRPRDLLLSALLFATRPFKPTGPLWRSWSGGDALQHALVARLIEYHFVVLTRDR